ncbi:MAG: Ig-like domain-containing protein, partial [Sedimentibacter sp.]
MKKNNKALSLILVLAMLFSIYSPAYAGTLITTSALWTDPGNYDADFYNELRANAYEPGDIVNISTPQQLAALALAVNTTTDVAAAEPVAPIYQGVTFTLTNDIELEGYNWDPIGHPVADSFLEDSYGFTGNFDGNGYKITNLTINGSQPFGSLFGIVGTHDGRCTLKNIDVDGSINLSSGVLATGLVLMAFNTDIIRCTTDVDIVLSTDSTGDTLFAAGILGISVGGNLIDQCINEGTISVIGVIDDDMMLGGIVALAVPIYAMQDSEDVGYDVGIFNSSNQGNISAAAIDVVIIGGIVALSYEENIFNCYNTGNMNGQGTAVTIGGAVAINVIGTLAMANAYSIGTIEGSSTNAGSVIMGGLIGNITTSTENLSPVLTFKAGIAEYGAYDNETPVLTDVIQSTADEVLKSQEYLDLLNNRVNDLNLDCAVQLKNWVIIEGMNQGYPMLAMNGEYELPEVIINSVTTVSSISQINVSNGTSINNIGLPESVSVNLSNSTTTSVAITWDGGTPEYNGSLAGTYAFSGTLALGDTISNPNNLKTSVDVVVVKSASTSSHSNKVVVITPVSNALVVLTGDVIDKMSEENSDLKATYGNVDYTVAAKDIDIREIAKKFGVVGDLSKLEVKINISAPSDLVIEKIMQQAAAKNYEIVISPMNFDITVTNIDTNETVTVSKFANYVGRMFEIPEGINSNKITTGIVYNEDGTFSHIPTKIVKVGDKYYAQLNSLTNSTYSVIWNPITFNDM